MKTPALPLALRRLAARHRRLLAAALTAVAVAAGLTAVQPAREPTVALLTAARSLDPGATVTDADVALTAIPRSLAPEDALSSPRDAVGRALAVGVGARTILTAGHVAQASRAAGDGLVVVALPLADDALASLVRPGGRLDLFGTTPTGPGLIASDVRVVGTPAPATGLGGLSTGRVVLVEVTPAVAALLAAGPASGGVTIAVR